MVALAGFGVSLLVWAAAAWSIARAQATAIANAPASWRERFGAEYERASRFRLRDAVLTTKTASALAVSMAVFVLLDLVDVVLPVQLGAAAAYAAWAAANERQGRLHDQARWVADGLEPLAPNRRLRWWHDASLFALWFAFFAAACFLAFALAELAPG